MLAIRTFKKVKDKKIEIDLPDGFDFDEVEIIILAKKQNGIFGMRRK